MKPPRRIAMRTRDVPRRACSCCFFICLFFVLIASSESVKAQTKNKTGEPQSAEVLIGPLDRQRDVAEAPETQFYPAPEDFPDGVLSYILEPDSRTHRNEFIQTAHEVYKRRDVVFRSFSRKTHGFGGDPSVLHLLVDNSNEITQAKLSPTGRYLMVREGFNAEIHTYPDEMFVWDIAAGRLVRNYKDDGLFWAVTRWSPNERYLAFIRGGDREGYVSGAADMGRIDLPQSLRVLSVATGETQDIRGDMGSLSFQWLPDSTLLYGECAAKIGERFCDRISLKTSRIGVSKSERFYAQKSVLLATNVKRTTAGTFYDTPASAVSADGRLVAFFGWPDAKEVQRAGKSKRAPLPSMGLGLYLFDRASKVQRRLGDWKAGALIWTSDGKLWLLRSGDAGGATLQSIDLAHNNQSSPLKLQGNAEGSNVYLSHFEIIGLTKNSHFLIVATNGQIENLNIVGGRGESNLINVANIQAIDLTNGTVSKLAKLVSAYALSWRESNPEPTR